MGCDGLGSIGAQLHTHTCSTYGGHTCSTYGGGLGLIAIDSNCCRGHGLPPSSSVFHRHLHAPRVSRSRVRLVYQCFGTAVLERLGGTLLLLPLSAQSRFDLLGVHHRLTLC